MPSGSWFCSVLSEIHYAAIGSPLPLLGLEEAEKIGLPKTQALASMECLPVEHLSSGSAGIHRVAAGCRVT